MTDLEQFMADRKAALTSMNKQQILDYMDKYDSESGERMAAVPEEIFWNAVHKAITGAKDLPIEFRSKSKAWLEERGSMSLDDGDLHTSACCKELAVVAGEGRGPGSTHWYECSKCGKTCDLMI